MNDSNSISDGDKFREAEERRRRLEKEMKRLLELREKEESKLKEAKEKEEEAERKKTEAEAAKREADEKERDAMKKAEAHDKVLRDSKNHEEMENAKVAKDAALSEERHARFEKEEAQLKIDAEAKTIIEARAEAKAAQDSLNDLARQETYLENLQSRNWIDLTVLGVEKNRERIIEPWSHLLHEWQERHDASEHITGEIANFRDKPHCQSDFSTLCIEGRVHLAVIWHKLGGLYQ